jgi:ubiquinone/menaquinone biosynthesis C-methylase UbiE
LADIRVGDKVIDIGAGAGDQAIAAARRVGLTGIVLATDISAGMLEMASEAARREGLSNFETRVGCDNKYTGLHIDQVAGNAD